MLKILTNNCDRQTVNYIPLRDLWITDSTLPFLMNKKTLVLQLTASTLALQSAEITLTMTLNNSAITEKKRDRLYNKFVARGVNTKDFGITFQIDSVTDTTMAEIMLENKTKNELNDLINNMLEEDQKLEEDLDFFYDNNASPKKEANSSKNLGERN